MKKITSIIHNSQEYAALKGDTGNTGPVGPQGATSVYDSTTQNFLTTLETTTGQDQTKTMTQKAITDEFDKFTEEPLTAFAWVKGGITSTGYKDDTTNKGIYRRTTEILFDTDMYGKVRMVAPNNKIKFGVYAITTSGSTMTIGSLSPGIWQTSEAEFWFEPQQGVKYVGLYCATDGTKASMDALTAADRPVLTAYYKSRTHDIDELKGIASQSPKTGRKVLAWKVGAIATTGYDYTSTTNCISEEFSVDSKRSFSVHNTHNDLVKFGVYEIKPDGTIHNHDAAGWNTTRGKTYKPQSVGSRLVIRIAPVSGSIADVDEANFPTVEYHDRGTVGFFRTYNNITGMLVWERKEISTNGIADNNDRLLAKLPSIGNVEVRVQRPLGSMSIWKKVGNTITCLYEPDYYGFRYTGDYTSEYYVMLQPLSGKTLDYPFTSVCLYSDEGKRYDKAIPDSFINKKIAIFGCSIEQGYNKKPGQDAVLAMQKPWGNLVAEETGSENFMNFSIGGALTPDTDPTKYGGELVGWKSAETNVTKVTGYDIVFVNLGSNDYGNKIALSTFATAFSYVLETLAENNTRVIVLTPFHRNSHPASPAATFDAYCEKEIEIAEEMGIEVIPTRTYTYSVEFVSCLLSDNLHINERGHRIVADAILDWMTQQS